MPPKFYVTRERWRREASCRQPETPFKHTLYDYWLKEADWHVKGCNRWYRAVPDVCSRH